MIWKENRVIFYLAFRSRIRATAISSGWEEVSLHRNLQTMKILRLRLLQQALMCEDDLISKTSKKNVCA